METVKINQQSLKQRIGRLSRMPGAKGDYYGIFKQD